MIFIYIAVLGLIMTVSQITSHKKHSKTIELIPYASGTSKASDYDNDSLLALGMKNEKTRH